MECEAQRMAQSDGLRIRIFFLKEESYEEACDGGN